MYAMHNKYSCTVNQALSIPILRSTSSRVVYDSIISGPPLLIEGTASYQEQRHENEGMR